MWQTVETVGGRAVLASGCLLVRGVDALAAVTANGTVYRFEFYPMEMEPTASLVTEGNALLIRFIGRFGGGTAWNFPDCGSYLGRKIMLGVEVRSYGAGAQATFSLNYTFSLGDQVPAQQSSLSTAIKQLGGA